MFSRRPRFVVLGPISEIEVLSGPTKISVPQGAPVRETASSLGTAATTEDNVLHGRPDLTVLAPVLRH
jgi:hypothetical protein